MGLYFSGEVVYCSFVGVAWGLEENCNETGS